MRIIILTIIAGVVGVSSAFYLRYYKPQTRVLPAPPALAEVREEVGSQISSDGNMNLTMKTIISPANNTKTYTFYTSDGEDNNKQLVFSKILDTTSSMTIPFNTWSPDNKHFFIVERGTAEDKVFVFNAGGEPFEGGQKYLDLTDPYKKSGNTNKFEEATGWAAPGLVIFNTTTPDGVRGPSFWFEVPSRAIIQLGLQF